MELYQIHFPNAWANEAYWDGLGDCSQGLGQGGRRQQLRGSDAVRGRCLKDALRRVHPVALKSDPILSGVNIRELEWSEADVRRPRRERTLRWDWDRISLKYSFIRPRAAKKLAESFFSQPASAELLDAIVRAEEARAARRKSPSTGPRKRRRAHSGVPDAQAGDAGPRRARLVLNASTPPQTSPSSRRRASKGHQPWMSFFMNWLSVPSTAFLAACETLASCRLHRHALLRSHKLCILLA